MRLRTFLKPLSFIPALVLMYMIFQFSGQEADVSSSMSYKASTYIVKSADYVFDLELEDWQISDYAVRIDKITRKLAHMTEYFLLAIAVSFPLYVYGLHGFLLIIVAGAFCVAFACSDEFHQTFVSGRAGQMKDVAIDSVGILAGIILVRIIGWTGRMTIFRPDPEEEERKRAKKNARRAQIRAQEEQDRQAMLRERRLREERRNERRAQEEEDRRREEQLRMRRRQDSYYETDEDEAGDAPDIFRSSSKRKVRTPQDDYSYRDTNDIEDDYDSVSSDELADDMPFSRLFRPRGRKKSRGSK